MFELMKSKLRRYFPFYKAKIMDFLVYKWQIYAWIFSDVLVMFITYNLWLAIYQNSGQENLNGFDFKMMMTYIILAQITYQVSYCSDSFWILGDEIRSGTIVMNLIKPINYRMSLIFGTLGSFTISLIFIVLPGFIIAYTLLYFGLGVELPSLLNIFLYLISCLLSLLIIDAMNFIIGLIAFFTQALFGVSIIKDSIMRFLSGTLIPLSFFPLWAKNIFSFLPFASLVETPILILLGQMDTIETVKSMLIQVLWIALFSFLAHLGYKKAVKHVVSQGG